MIKLENKNKIGYLEINKIGDKYKIDFLSITFDEFKNTKFYKEIKYAPSIIIIKEGKIVTYLDPNSDDDFEKYQDADKLGEWIKNYVKVSENE